MGLSKHQIRKIADRTNIGTQIIEDILIEAEKQGAIKTTTTDPLESQEFFDVMQQYRIAPMEKQQLVGQRFNDVKQWLRDNLL